VVAGRTDAGVHATGQVCHVSLGAGRWDLMGETLLVRLNAVLPDDIRVHRAVRVPETFDARFSALYRRYEYRVCDDPYGSPPLRRRDTLAWAYPLDLVRLNEASGPLHGEHDFAAYCRRKEYATTVRSVTELSWRQEPEGIVIGTVQADAFCQAMVRSLVGALLPVGDGRRPVTWPASLLDRRERASEVVVAPAHGLTLIEVGYPTDEEHYAEQAERARRRRGGEGRTPY
jgi:tRNA pseudouridine38-40 synthase